MLLGTLGESLLGNILAGKGMNRTEGGIVRPGYGNEKVWKTTKNNGFLMSRHPLTNFEIQKYQNESRFNVVYYRDNLPKIKGGAYVMNLDE